MFKKIIRITSKSRSILKVWTENGPLKAAYGNVLRNAKAVSGHDHHTVGEIVNQDSIQIRETASPF